MSAVNFYEVVIAKTPKSAFNKAVRAARKECGTKGYTGTIAEKKTFKLVVVPDGVTVHEHAFNLEESDPEISDPLGPAGCIELETGKYLFFGWAES